MKRGAWKLSLGAVAVCAASAIFASVASEQTVTGTVSGVEEYTLYVGTPPVAYTLTTTTAMDAGLLDDAFPQSLVGKNVSITYQTFDDQNCIVALQVVPDAS